MLSRHVKNVYTLTGDQRIPDWLLASFLGWRSCKAFVVSENFFGQAGDHWKTAGQWVAYEIFGKTMNLEAPYLKASRTAVDSGKVNGQ